MAFRNLIAFGAGEITPELAERDNLEKFRTGLKALRNGIVTKYGGLRSRRGFVLSEEVETTIMYSPQNVPVILIFGREGFKLFKNEKDYKFEVYTDSYGFFTLSDTDLKNMHFTNDDEYLYAFAEGKMFFKILIKPESFLHFLEQVQDFYFFPPNVTSAAPYGVATGAPAGYTVDYAFTMVNGGQETTVTSSSITGLKLPQGTGQYNTLTVRVESTTPPNPKPDEVRWYRRPAGSGAWGFIGLATPVASVTPGFDWDYIVTDVGQDSDLTNQPPEFVTGFGAEVPVRPRTGIIYQNRLLLAIKNKIYGSRTEYILDFTRDFPLQDDSGLTFKTGSSGGAKIGRLYDGRGLIITTNVGIYETPSDVLKYDTAFAIKKSNVIHDERIPVVGMGSSTFVKDKRLSGVFKLSSSTGNNYDLTTSEVSIFSGHLLENHDLVSWAIQDDGTQILWCVREDGVLLSFSYQEDQELQSWARHDILGAKVRSVVSYKQPGQGDLLCAVIERDGVNYLEVLSRKDLDVYNYIATDSTVIYKNQMVGAGKYMSIYNGSVPAFFQDGYLSYNAVIDRQVPYNGMNTLPMDDRYEGMVIEVEDQFIPGLYYRWELVGGIANFNWIQFAGPFSNVPGKGAVGSVFRFFNEDTKEFVDYEVTAYNTTLSVEINLLGFRDMYEVMNSSNAANPPLRLYNCYQTFTTLEGLEHLEGQAVSVRADGFTEASPLNDKRNYAVYIVDGGEIELEDRAAIISVGVPMVTDIQTLDAGSVEQVSDKAYSSIVNKLFVSYYKSRGLYIGSDLPKDNSLDDMEDHEEFFEADEGIAEYAPHEPYSRREEVVIQGGWQAASSTAFRNVDPQPIGVRGIMLDEEKIGD